MVATLVTPLIRRRIEPYYTLAKSDRALKDSLDEGVEWSGVDAPGAREIEVEKLSVRVLNGEGGGGDTPTQAADATAVKGWDISLRWVGGAWIRT